MATAALIVVLAVSVALTAALGHARGGAGKLPLSVIIQGWVDIAGWMLIGLDFGAALLNTAPAIVAYLILPNAWNAVGGTLHSLSGVATWLSASKSTAPLTVHTFDASAMGAARGHAYGMGGGADAGRDLAPSPGRHLLNETGEFH